ncbi:MAG TPA: PLP-dependent aspartate aminotransferase family protein [Saprospiraceae bacterium]|nr:PLP-dependent aspartate aminotransferase family protein [Saprospiraceae bacterium]
MHHSTQLLHALPIDPLTGAISVPVYQTATFVQEGPGEHKGFDYARSNNPTRQVLEDLIAQLEGGVRGLAFASGLAAIDCVLKLLKAGDEIVAVDDIYGGAFRLFTHVYEKFGIKIHYVDTTDADNLLDVLSPRTRLVWLESPTNPTLKISDIARICELAHSAGAWVVVDNTFASPLLQQPLSLGADVVVHSATKYLAGHSDLIAGLLAVRDAALGERLKFIQNASGGILGPWDSWLTIRGIETLPLRLEAHCKNALAVAQALAAHEAVDKVYYPGLPSHPNHAVAQQQQQGRGGGVVSFSLKTDTEAAARAFVTHTRLFRLAESLGGVKSLVCHPASMTHKSIPRERRLLSGVQDSLIRLSCGIEHSRDLVSDVERALRHVAVREDAPLCI